MNAIHKNLFESVHCVQDTKEGRVGGGSGDRGSTTTTVR